LTTSATPSSRTRRPGLTLPRCVRFFHILLHGTQNVPRIVAKVQMSVTNSEPVPLRSGRAMAERVLRQGTS